MADLIDRQELISWLSKDPLFPEVESFGLTDVIKSRPSVDAELVRHGSWGEIHEVFDYIKCSECGGVWCTEDNDTDTFNYCPNCGAKMKVVTE